MKEEIEFKTFSLFKCTVPLNRDKYQLSFLRNGLLITSNPGALTVACLTQCRLHKADGEWFPHTLSLKPSEIQSQNHHRKEKLNFCSNENNFSVLNVEYACLLVTIQDSICKAILDSLNDRTRSCITIQNDTKHELINYGFSV